MFGENLKKQFVNIYKPSNHYISKFIVLLQKDAYPYEYMKNWEKFNKTLLTEKRKFLQSPKHGGSCWYRLHTRKKSLKKI